MTKTILIQKIKNHGLALIKFMAVGGTTALFHYVVYLLFNLFMFTRLAYALSYFLEMALNYTLTNKFTFKSKPTAKNGIGFIIVRIFALGLEMALFEFFLTFCGVDEKFAPLPVYVIVGLVNYMVMSVLFRNKRPISKETLEQDKSSVYLQKRAKLRRRLCYWSKNILSWHYGVSLEGMEYMENDKAHLLLANHPAYIDNVILLSQLYKYQLTPLSDERYFHKKLIRFALNLVNALSVPNLEYTHSRDSADLASNLQVNITNMLAYGRHVVFNPSGHVTSDGKEHIGNRRLAYEVSRNLPDNADILLVKTEGLRDSMWSKFPSRWSLRRNVKITFIPVTEQLVTWSQTLTRREFNEKLEQLFNDNQPLTLK